MKQKRAISFTRCPASGIVVLQPVVPADEAVICGGGWLGRSVARQRDRPKGPGASQVSGLPWANPVHSARTLRRASHRERKPEIMPSLKELPKDQLTSTELDTLSGAVVILLEARYTATMDDPGLSPLLREFGKALDDEKTEREQLQASIAS